MSDYGRLIRAERMQKGWSQEELCGGVCAVSYLSKIESGKAEPSEEILTLLLERLGLAPDEDTRLRAEKLAADGYERLFSGGEPLALDEAALASYRAVPAGPDLMLLSRMASDKPEPLPKAYEAQMDARRLALQRILEKRYDEAVRLLPIGYTYFRKGVGAFESGDYAPAIEALQRGCSLAAEEGRPKIMLRCRMYLGNVYCMRRDTENMHRHYAIAARLARALHEDDALRTIVYNIAAAALEAGDCEQAYRSFRALPNPTPMMLHKLAIACEKTGRRAEAIAALDLADALDSDDPPKELCTLLCGIVRYRLEHPDYLSDEAYGKLLSEGFMRCRAELRDGSARFHLPWMLEWLSATRRYKQAFELLSEFER